MHNIVYLSIILNSTVYGHRELLGWNKLEKNYWYPHPRPVLSCGHINIHSFLDKDTTGKDFRDDKQPSRSMWSEFAFIDKSCSRRALLRRRSWLAASASCNWKMKDDISNNFKSKFSYTPTKENLKWVGNRGLVFTSYVCVS